MTFADKVLNRRTEKRMTQEELGDLIGTNRKTIRSYEYGNSRPHNSTMIKLAKALDVSLTYLMNDDCEDINEGKEKDTYFEEAHEKYGSAGVRDMQSLLAENTALFAGGDLSPEQMDMFYNAITAVYNVCREEASKKFGRKAESEADEK